MDPNSSHQLWSKWTIVVRPPKGPRPPIWLVEDQSARLLRSVFGTAGQGRVRRFPQAWVLEALVDTNVHPHDPGMVGAYRRRLTVWALAMFGPSAQVQVKARLMAGARLDRQAPDQLLILPRLSIPLGVM